MAGAGASDGVPGVVTFPPNKKPPRGATPLVVVPWGPIQLVAGERIERSTSGL